ncbi:hypothetical protein HFK18_20950|uniref:hypothetical protein n=1 Tax=Stenotrophomonas sp. SbOxS2 TaxID=2723885 RepID=UPI0015D37624|nr:hypothetical protein [Stenotrophomonas sp. SbOxS2]NYU00938.1 hypothetical protein [Stenotrophomonas sp. SbOxS2]
MAEKQPNKRGAKPLAQAEPVVQDLDSDKLAERSQELVTLGEHQSEVVDQFGDGLPWHPDHYENAIRGELRRGCEAFLRAGRYLVVARECAAHGEWQQMLERLSISKYQALRMMEAARRISALSKVADPQLLIGAARNQTHLIELLSLPEDQFTELATEGETNGLTLDGVEHMSLHELRAAIRDARADLDAKDQRITKLSDDLNKAEEKTAKAQKKWKKATPDEQSQELLTQLEQAAAQVRIAIASGSEEAGFSGAAITLMQHAEQHDLNVDEQVAGIIASLINDLRLVRDHQEVGVTVIHDRRLADWKREG